MVSTGEAREGCLWGEEEECVCRMRGVMSWIFFLIGVLGAERFFLLGVWDTKIVYLVAHQNPKEKSKYLKF